MAKLAAQGLVPESTPPAVMPPVERPLHWQGWAWEGWDWGRGQGGPCSQVSYGVPVSGEAPPQHSVLIWGQAGSGAPGGEEAWPLFSPPHTAAPLFCLLVPWASLSSLPLSPLGRESRTTPGIHGHPAQRGPWPTLSRFCQQRDCQPLQWCER